MKKDPHIDKFEGLPNVRLLGPQLSDKNPAPLWRLSATSPLFGAENAYEWPQRERRRRKTGETADHVFGVRVLLADPERIYTAKGKQAKWRRPRLLDIHVAFGATESTPAQYSNIEDTLEISLDPRRKSISADYGTVLRALNEGPGIPDAKAPFVHVLGEPLISEASSWPKDQTTIKIPAVRIVAGRIGIRANLRKMIGRRYKDTDCAWLRGLKIAKADKDDLLDPVNFWLVPEGIEFDAVLPFPNVGDLKGRVLLTSCAEGEEVVYYLNLLRPVVGTETSWLAAWRAITPSPEREDALLGLTLKADRSQVPAFRWRIKVKKDSVEIKKDEMEVPGAALSIALRSPRVGGLVDGSAKILFHWVKVKSPAQGAVEISGTLGGHTGPSIKIESKEGELDLTLEQGAQANASILDVDEDELAGDLRSAYGLPTPPARAPTGKDAPIFDRPILPAFLPLQNGWLQLPVPNLPPVDTSIDANLATVPVKARDSVLDGFFRIRKPGVGTEVVSAYSAEPPTPAPSLHGMPFELTVEAASGVSAKLTLTSNGKDAASLDDGTVSLFGTTLASRGLLMVSADRPDALEALPRLGAGPGMFIPVSLRGVLDGESKLASIVGVEINELDVKVKQPSGSSVSRTRLDSLKADYCFNAVNLRWLEMLERRGAIEALLASRRIVRDSNLQVRRLLSELENAANEVGVCAGELAANKSTNRSTKIEEERAEKALAEAKINHLAAQKKVAEALSGEQAPLPAVVWERHEAMPLATTMPMTRAARSSTRPLESRDLLPYWLKGTATTPSRLASLSLSGNHLPKLELGTTRFRVVGWPAMNGPKTVIENIRPERGVFLAAVGVPGVEWLSDNGKDFVGALRYDLPTLDEAFAMAELPPMPPVDNKQAPEVTEPQIVPTALDWSELGRFWQEQERRLQNARVVDSYVTPFGGIASSDPVTNLIRGLDWPAHITLFEGKAGEILPYGSVKIKVGGTGEPVNGNQALLGHSGDYKIDDANANKLSPSSGGPIRVVGYAPSTYKVNGDNIYLDNRSSGAGENGDEESNLLIRKVRVPPPALHYTELISAAKPFNISINGVEFGFWFKDVLVEGNETVLSQRRDLAFEVWDDTRMLAASGFEWRFAAIGNPDRAFVAGRNTIPFFGFGLEPLRLDKMSFEKGNNKTIFQSAEIICRLTLGPAQDTPDPTENLVRLMLTSDGSASLVPFADRGKISFVLRCKHGELSRRVTLDLSFQTIAQFLKVDSVSIEVAGTMVGIHAADAMELKLPTRADGNIIVLLTNVHNGPDSAMSRLVVRNLEIGVAQEGTYRSPLEVLNLGLGLKVSTLSIDPDGTSRLFLKPIQDTTASTVESAGAITASLSGGGFSVGAATFEMAFGLAARTEILGNNDQGALALGVGRLEADLRQRDGDWAEVIPGVNVSQARVRIVVTGEGSKAGDWEGDIFISGRIRAENAISWPAVTGGPAIPIPKEESEVKKGETISGRVTVEPENKPPASHAVVWQFANHRLDLDLASKLAADDTEAIWSTPVLAHHTLARGFDLRLIKSDEIENMPAEGRAMVALGMINQNVYIRIFDKNGERMVDLREMELSEEKKMVIEKIKVLMGDSWLTSKALGELEKVDEMLSLVSDVAEGDFQKKEEIRWTGLETIAVGSPRALVPELELKEDDFDGDRTTFAPREQYVYRKGKRVPWRIFWEREALGMSHAGRGAVATVLQGALGAAFRVAFWMEFSREKDPPKVLIVGGFLGLLETEDGTGASPLLRLPVIAGLPASINQTRLTEKKFDLAWQDGPAARLVALTRPTGPKPANASLQAITASLIGGSRALVDPTSTEASDPVGAILVEQSFPKGEFPSAKDTYVEFPSMGALAEMPFFLAAAVSVSRILNTVDESNGKTVPSLSLVAGYLPRGKDARGKDAPPQPLAASIRMLGGEVELAPEEDRAELAVIGSTVSVVPWKGSLLDGDDPETLTAAVSARALSEDPKPVAALLVVTEPNNLSRIQPLILRRESLEDFHVPSNPNEPIFPDLGRGPMHLPDNGTTGHWLPAPLEGPSYPIRDYKPTDPASSGIAGLSRRMVLPLQAGKAEQIENSPASQMSQIAAGSAVKATTCEGAAGPLQFTWLSQTKVPVYLPLKTKGLFGPPLGWLTPAPPNVRLPTNEAILEKLREGAPPSGNAPGTVRTVQPFLPGSVDAAEVGERPGILTVRRTRLLRNLGHHEAFDDSNARFGRPGQAGSSFARTLRTPRPGPLPENRGDPARDRRVQASPLRWDESIDALFGSADSISGTHELLGPWSVTVAAAPDRRSIVTDRWDGTVKLLCRIDLKSIPAAGPDPDAMKVLAALLLDPTSPTDDDPMTLTNTNSSADVKIGGTVIPMHELVWREATGWVSSDKVATAIVELILNPEKLSVGTPRVEIATALSVEGPLPEVELRWTVCPFSQTPSPNRIEFEGRLKLSGVSQTALAVGRDRAPVTLRMPLYPVTGDRGTLPVVPATLLFNDPAYDRELANVPASNSKVLPETGDIPAGAASRGPLKLTLHVDRRQAHRMESITLMLDVHREKPMDDVAQTAADAAGTSPGGELIVNFKVTGKTQPNGLIQFQLEPKNGEPRLLALRKEQLSENIPFAEVIELPIASLLEKDGSPASLAPGDMLTLSAWIPADANPDANRFWIFNPENPAKLAEQRVDADRAVKIEVTVRVTLTGEPTTPPPSALYVALHRTQRDNDFAIATALHAQSPLPARSDLISPARDFRKGLMRRQAIFAWPLQRPEEEFSGHALAIVKQDRNGQTWLPEKPTDFVQPEDLTMIKQLQKEIERAHERLDFLERALEPHTGTLLYNDAAALREKEKEALDKLLQDRATQVRWIHETNDGWMRVRPDNGSPVVSLPSNLKVALTATEDSRDKFTALEGIWAGLRASMPSGVLQATDLHHGAVAVAFEKKTGNPETIDGEAYAHIIRISYSLSGNEKIVGPFPAKTDPRNPVSTGDQVIEIPDYPHFANESYGRLRTVWFRIGTTGDRYIHPGRISAGCITCAPRHWVEICNALLKGRKPNGNNAVGDVSVTS